MKKKIFSISVLLLFAVFIFSFKMIQPGGTTPVSDIISGKIFRKPIKDKQFYISTTEVMPIDTAYVIKDTLHIITRKLPGCDAGNFKLVWNGDMSKSSPPQTSVRLFKAADTECREKHKFDLIFNIGPLRFKQDSTTNKTTLIHLGGWKEPLKYEFDSLSKRQKK